MGLFDSIFGRSAARRSAATSQDEQAIARYRYLLKTAPPEAIEQTHAEAFARLTPEQRRKVLEGLQPELSAGERSASQAIGDEPGALARVATRAEMRQPGAMERAFGRAGGGMAPGGMLAGSFLSGVAGAVIGTVIGSAIAQSLFDPAGPDLGAGGPEAGDAGGDGGFTDTADMGQEFDVGGNFDV